ncbi:MAG: DUF6510 family protein [Ktedonobacterales bacterium]|jgi:hypothetical protein
MSDMSAMSDGSPVTANGMMGTSDDDAFRLDGNAAAGLLAEIFVVEMTNAQSTCAHCGHTGPLGSLLLYGGQVGTVLRCPTCDDVQLRIVRVHGQYWMDMRGMTLLRITPSNPA